MEIDELIRILDLSPRHSCCVDISSVVGAPGYIRTVSIYQHYRVAIEFEVWGYDEGGLYFWATFKDAEDAVASVSDYIDRQFTDWEIDPAYPDRPPETGTQASHESFMSLLTNGMLPLPASGSFQTPGSFWTQYLHPTYRVAKPEQAG